MTIINNFIIDDPGLRAEQESGGLPTLEINWQEASNVGKLLNRTSILNPSETVTNQEEDFEWPQMDWASASDLGKLLGR